MGDEFGERWRVRRRIIRTDNTDARLDALCMVSLDQIDRLQTPDGQRLLDEVRALAPTPATAIAIATRLRKTWPPELVSAALEMHDLRERGRAKFVHAPELWFTRDGLEQATAEPIAAYRAGRYAGPGHILDLCCGIGGDLLALAAANPSADLTAVDRDPLHLAIAARNAAVAGVDSRVSFLEADVRDVPIPSGAAVFIDPARRSGSGRLAVGESEPPLAWCLGLAEGGRAVGIKFAPGIDRDAVPPGWELEVIALGPDLKEAVLWSPALARAERAAVVIDAGAMHRLEPVHGDPVGAREPQPGEILFDPNPAITRAGLVDDLARSLGASKIDDRIGFLVSATPVTTPFARPLAIRASLPWNEKSLRRVLRDMEAGPVDIRRRGLAGDVDAISKRLRGKGRRPFTIAMTRVQDRPWAIVCEALPAT